MILTKQNSNTTNIDCKNKRLTNKNQEVVGEMVGGSL